MPTKDSIKVVKCLKNTIESHYFSQSSVEMFIRLQWECQCVWGLPLVVPAEWISGLMRRRCCSHLNPLQYTNQF